jgi:hypothetical protein
MASQNAKPKRAYVKSCPLREGFLLTASIRPAKTTPIPTPDPATEIVANPAPRILAEASIKKESIGPTDPLVKQMTLLTKPAENIPND